MLARESVRSRFRELEKRIEELTRSVIPQEANSRDSNALVSDQSSSAEELRIGEIRVSSPAIIIPGIAQARQPLIVPISEDTEQQEGSTTATDTRVESSVVDELVAAIEAPLAKLGLRKQRYLKGLAGGGACTWVGWWLDESVDLKEADGILKYIGPWFIKSVVGSLSPVLFLEPPAISKEQQEELLLPYIISDPSNGTSISCSWQITASIVGALASRSSGASGSPAALTLVTRLLDKAAASGQLGPRLALQRIGSIEPQRASTARSSFGEYLQLACTLPERIANKIDPQSIPASLLPHSYFSQLAKQAIECSDTANYSNDRASSKDAKPGLVAELWTKLCRVGQLDCLCVELAIALLAAADERICGSASASDDRLSKLAAVLANVPTPFQGRLLNGVVRQMDAMGSRAVAGSGERYEFGMQMALVICAILHRIFDQNNSDADIDKAIASLITRDGAAGGGSVAKRSTITYQAISLALQILGGNCPANDLPVGSARVFPDLVPGVLGRCILPMWSYAELVEHGRNDEVKCLTMLILMCVGALSSQSRTELSMSAAFTRAIPRFLDAPSPLIRLSGIIVADAIVNSDPKRSEVDGEVIDFGLDDIIRDAKQPVGGQQIVRESAEYIISMRRYKQSIAAQWKDDVADEDAKKQARNENGGKSLDEAAKYIRAYSGIDKADAVLAPRQSSMVANGQDELRSQYVKPRTPVFLRDCLAYLKDQGESSNAERVKIGLFALADCIERADTKAVEELWLKVANKVLYTYNRGPDDVDWMWDMERRRALVALAVRLPEVLGPFLADRSCDRNLTMKDREIVFSAIATACLQLSGIEGADGKDGGGDSAKGKVEDITQRLKDKSAGSLLGSGTVVRRSRRLDLMKAKQGGDGSSTDSKRLSATKQRYASIVGPSFFFPLISQYGKSDMTANSSDIRRDVGLLEKYLNTLAIVLYSAGAASHQITMNREFWDLTRVVRYASAKSKICESPPILDALLFGIDVTLSPDRALSVPTLAREFRGDIADMLAWIGTLVEGNLLSPSSMAHASRIVARLHELQGDVYRRLTSKDLNQYTSII